MDELLTQLILFVPRLIGAVAIAILGSLLAFVARRSLMFLLHGLGFDALCDRLGVTALLREGGIERPPSQIIGTIIFYIVLVLVVLAAVGSLGLDFLAVTLNEVFLYAPRALAAVFLLILGTAASGLLAQLTGSALCGVGVTRTEGLMTFVRYGVIFISALLAAAVLQVDITILIVITVIVLGGIALTASLALGLGLRGLSQNVAAGRYLAEGIVEGDRISVNGFSGTVEQVGYAITTVRSADGRTYLIPNAYFMEHVVEKGGPNAAVSTSPPAAPPS